MFPQSDSRPAAEADAPGLIDGTIGVDVSVNFDSTVGSDGAIPLAPDGSLAIDSGAVTDTGSNVDYDAQDVTLDDAAPEAYVSTDVAVAQSPCDGAPQSSPIVALGGSGAGACALRAAGDVYCWGWGNIGQRGNGTLVTSATPMPVSNVCDADILAVGHADSCAHHRAGGWSCWGDNDFGSDGDGTTSMNLIPTNVVEPGVDPLQLSEGAVLGCAAAPSGLAYCWGYNGNGALGDGTTIDHYVPTQVPSLTNVAAVAVGKMDNSGAATIPGPHACALLRDGTVDCWGANLYGEVGDGTTIDRLTPVPVVGLAGVVEVKLGLWHSCARRSDGSVYCWGFNVVGSLGDGTMTNRSAPVPVVGLSDAVAISMGDDFSCALRAAGTVVCWGDNWFDELATAAGGISPTPVAIDGVSDVVELAAGEDHVCVRTRAGSVLCWGANNWFDLGDPSYSGEQRATPEPVVGLY